MKLRVNDICKTKGITQKHLAALVGITPVGLAKSLSGNTTLATLEKIATALNVPITELFAAPSVGAASVSCPHCGKSISVSVSVKTGSTETDVKE